MRPIVENSIRRSALTKTFCKTLLATLIDKAYKLQNLLKNRAKKARLFYCFPLVYILENQSIIIE